jgi:chromosome segregation ATPase
VVAAATISEMRKAADPLSALNPRLADELEKAVAEAEATQAKTQLDAKAPWQRLQSAEQRFATVTSQITKLKCEKDELDARRAQVKEELDACREKHQVIQGDKFEAAQAIADAALSIQRANRLDGMPADAGASRTQYDDVITRL